MEFLILSIVLFLFLIDMNLSRIGKELEILNKKMEELTDTVWKNKSKTTQRDWGKNWLPPEE